MNIVLEGTRQQFAQATIAFAMLHHQQHPRGPVAIRRIGDPHIAAENRLDACAACRPIKFDPAKGIGQIGEANRRHPDLSRALDRIAHAHQAIDDGIFGVQA